MNQIIITGFIKNKFKKTKEDKLTFTVVPLNEQLDKGASILLNAYNKTAQIIENNFPEGTRVGIQAHIHAYVINNDDKKEYGQCINVDYIEFLEKKPQEPMQKEDKELTNEEI